MTDSTFSPHWYRVCDLHLQLRAQVVVVRQFYRGQLWFVLQDPLSGKHYRMDAAAYQFVGRLDGRSTVQAIWDALLDERGEAAPTQNDVIRLLGELHEASLLQGELAAEFSELFRRRDEKKAKRAKSFVNPLAFRVPLFDPSRLLERLLPHGRWLLHPAVLLVWLLIVATALFAASAHWPALRSYAGVHLLTPQCLFLIWLCYPVIKALHELGHAFATRAFGGAVREMGITLLLLVPVPYVDASTASALRSKWQRVVVSAIGVMVELLLAAVATLLWLNTQDGVARDIAFVTMFIGSVSTLFFNGNPLMRFDGYYALCDVLELPNLAGRARAYVAYLAQRHLLGIRSLACPAASVSERSWLFVYGIAAWLYRIVLSVLIALWISSKSVLLALLLLAWFALSLFVRPVLRIARFLLTSSRLARRRAKALSITAGAVAAALAFVFYVPLPLTARVEGVVWLPEHARVRAGSEGFVERVLVADGARVTRDQPLVYLSDPALLAQKEELEAQLQRHTLARSAALSSDTARAQRIGDEIAKVQAELETVDKRVEELVVRSGADGTLAMPHASDMLASYVARGTVLAHVLSAEPLTVRTVLPQEEVALLRRGGKEVQVRLAERLDQALVARVAADTPGASQALPSAALGDKGGGGWITDPADAQGLKTLQPFYVMDLLVGGKRAERTGGRAYALFDLGREPLAARCLRAGRRLFLRHFATST